MALNTDFRVKNSLYVGSSACFIGNVDAPIYLSAGTDLLDIFIQDGEVATSCTLSAGTGITSFTYNGTTAAEVSIDSTCNTTWNSAYTTVAANSATWDAGGGSNLEILDEGSSLTNTASAINFTGAGVTTTNVGAIQTVDIPSGGGANAAYDSTHQTVSALSGGWETASTWVTTNGSNAIDGIATGSAQGQVAVTDVGGTTSQVDVNGLGTTDGPTFAAQTEFCAGSILNNVSIGVGGGPNTISTFGANTLILGSGNFNVEIGHAAWPDTDLGITGQLTLSGTAASAAGASNSVLTQTASGLVTTDTIDGRVWGSTLADVTAATVNRLTKFCDANGIIDSNITDDGNSIQIAGGLSATGTLSGDGSGLTGVTATPSFPTVGAATMASADKIFINDGATCQTACNKHITVSNFVTDFAGTGLAAEGSEQFSIKNAAGLTDQAVLKWDDGNGQLTDSIISETALGNVTIAGGATITGNLSVQGDLTCIDTLLQTTSAICVINAGTGPALYAEQTGASQPIATFVDTEGGQVVIGDTGSVGIGILGDTPGEKLTVSGNISANGDLRIDGNTTLYGTISTNIGTGTGNTVVINTSTGLATDEIDSKVWGGAVVDYSTSTTNAVPKFTGGTGTVGDSSIADSGTLVTVDSDTKINDGHTLQVFTGDGVHYSTKQTFTATVSGGDGYVLPTFIKANLRQVKYEVSLINGANVTAFEVNAVYNGIDPCGTVYGLIDAQATSQLVGAAITAANTTIDINLSAATSGTTAIVTGTALY